MDDAGATPSTFECSQVYQRLQTPGRVRIALSAARVACVGRSSDAWRRGGATRCTCASHSLIATQPTASRPPEPPTPVRATGACLWPWVATVAISERSVRPCRPRCSSGRGVAPLQLPAACRREPPAPTPEPRRSRAWSCACRSWPVVLLSVLLSPVYSRRLRRRHCGVRAGAAADAASPPVAAPPPAAEAPSVLTVPYG